MGSRTTVMHDDLGGVCTGPSGSPLYSTLAAALAAAGTGPVRIIIAGTLAVDADAVVGEGITLEFVEGGMFEVAAGKAVAISGLVYAPARQIFTGDGKDNVTFSRDDCVIVPAWWGSGSGVRIGSLASTNIQVTNLTATSTTGQTAAYEGDVSANNLTAANKMTAGQVWEGSHQLSAYLVKRGGDTMTGPLILSQDPEDPFGAATRQFVEANLHGGGAVDPDDLKAFGMIVFDGTETYEAVRPHDSITLQNGFGFTVTGGQYDYWKDEPGESDFIMYFRDSNALALSTAVASGTATLAAGDSIACDTPSIVVAGDGGAVDLTSDPQIVAGSFAGQPLLVIGGNNTNTVKIDDGTGVKLVGGSSVTLGAGDTLRLYWNSALALWVEESRANV